MEDVSVIYSTGCDLPSVCGIHGLLIDNQHLDVITGML